MQIEVKDNNKQLYIEKLFETFNKVNKISLE